jgi:hypothetical protein
VDCGEPAAATAPELLSVSGPPSVGR